MNTIVRVSRLLRLLLWQVLTAKRWELLKTMCGAGPMSIRKAARHVKRDVKAVQGDVTSLLDAGVLSRTSNGEVEFPFDAVKVEFLVSGLRLANDRLLTRVRYAQQTAV